jgi:hypothetical protein
LPRLDGQILATTVVIGDSLAEVIRLRATVADFVDALAGT